MRNLPVDPAGRKCVCAIFSHRIASRVDVQCVERGGGAYPPHPIPSPGHPELVPKGPRSTTWIWVPIRTRSLPSSLPARGPPPRAPVARPTRTGPRELVAAADSHSRGSHTCVPGWSEACGLAVRARRQRLSTLRAYVPVVPHAPHTDARGLQRTFVAAVQGDTLHDGQKAR